MSTKTSSYVSGKVGGSTPPIRRLSGRGCDQNPRTIDPNQIDFSSDYNCLSDPLNIHLQEILESPINDLFKVQNNSGPEPLTIPVRDIPIWEARWRIG